MGYVSLALRLMLASVCLVAVAGKLAGRSRMRAFMRMLVGIGVPPRLVSLVGAGVVGGEFAVASLAPWPATALAAAGLAAVLFAALTGGVAVAVQRGTTATCRCFGRQNGRLGRVHVSRNAALTALAVAATVTAGAATPSVHPIGLAAAIAAATLGALTIVFWEDLAAVALSPEGQP